MLMPLQVTLCLALENPHLTGNLLAFTLEGELPDAVGPRVISDLFGGREKVRFVELNSVSEG